MKFPSLHPVIGASRTGIIVGHHEYFIRFAKKITMRVLSGCLLATLLFSSCHGLDSNSHALTGPNANIDSSSLTQVQWMDSASRDYGKVIEGQILQIAYRFKNIGDKPLVIKRVQVSCGCTVAEQPDKPVLPGEEGVIKAAFNSEGHTGQNNKTMYVFANIKGSPSSELHFKVDVEKKKW